MSSVDVLLGVFLLVILCHKGSNFYLSDTRQTDCKNYKGHRPNISPPGFAFAEYVRPGDFREASVQNTTVVGDVNAYLLQQFNCSYHKPIQWIFNLDPDESELNIQIDFSERIIINRTPQNEESQYKYTANFRLLYFVKHLKNGVLFSCEPIPISDPCERNFLQTQNGKFESEPTPYPTESLKAMSEALLRSSREISVTKYFDQMSCPLKLFLKTEMGNVISFRWETQKGSTRGFEKTTIQTNETSYFENVYRFDKIHEPYCVRILNDTEECVNCRYVSQVKNYTVNAVIFHAVFQNVSFLYKGMFSVPKNARSERRLYLDWQISDMVIQKRMIKLLVPEKVYANDTFIVRCRVSLFFFSYGTQISDKDSVDVNESKKSKEIYTPFGYREVVHAFRFQEANQVKKITCFSPLKKSSRWIEKSKAVLVEHGTRPYIGNTYENTTEFQTVDDGTESVVAECNVTGNPTPDIRWSHKLPINESRKLNITQGKHFSRIQFPKWESAFAGTYICETVNSFGRTTKSITFRHKIEEANTELAVIISSTLGGLMVGLAIVIGLLAWKIRKQRLEFEMQTQKAIEEFRNGMKAEDLQNMDAENPNISFLQMSYNEAFEVPQNNWVIENKILGTGQFGIVRLGSVVLKGERIKVAVKSLKSSVEIDEFKSFLFELKIMAYLGQHKNIVSLVAACTEGIDNRDIVIGVEFCDNGSLLDYLRKYRGSFLNMVGSDGKIVSELAPIYEKSSVYANLTEVCTHQLYRWAYHIACGMDYLRIRKVLHGDLAARNVLLSSRKTAKVGDFGLSRVLMNSENYTKQTQAPLPWKWMAPESLSMRVFSVNSDVWAYGICLAEVFTLGQSPYPGISWSPNFLTQLENGMRMEKPEFCTTDIYKVMQSCWEYDPQQRPSYVKIKRKLSKGLKRLSTLISTHKEQEEQRRLSSTTTASARNSSRSKTSSTTVPPDVDLPSALATDDAGVYSNVPRRSMNYYKNC